MPLIQTKSNEIDQDMREVQGSIDRLQKTARIISQSNDDIQKLVQLSQQVQDRAAKFEPLLVPLEDTFTCAQTAFASFNWTLLRPAGLPLFLPLCSLLFFGFLSLSPPPSLVSIIRIVLTPLHLRPPRRVFHSFPCIPHAPPPPIIGSVISPPSFSSSSPSSPVSAASVEVKTEWEKMFEEADQDRGGSLNASECAALRWDHYNMTKVPFEQVDADRSAAIELEVTPLFTFNPSHLFLSNLYTYDTSRHNLFT